MLFITAYAYVTWYNGNLVSAEGSYGCWLDPDSIVTATPQNDVNEAARAVLRSLDAPGDLDGRKLRGAQLMGLSLVNGKTMLVEWDLDLQTFLANRAARMQACIRDLQADERAERSGKGAL